ncbi:MAG: PhoH family protein [Planctomycetes bacterium]|nr:PhoH family protein [Planctomycetota bacterium]
MKAEKTLELQNQEETAKLFGTFDRYLRLIRNAFNVQIFARDSLLRIQGVKFQVDQAYSILRNMLDKIRTEGSIALEEVEEMVFGLQEGQPRERRPSAGLVHAPVYAPKSDGQKRYLEAMEKHDIVFALGPAGTGKTYLAVCRAVSALRAGLVRKLVLTRPAVEAGERLGFLPGDLQAKVNPYLRPLYDAISNLMDFAHMKRLMDNEIIEIVPLAYMRGRTLDGAFIILDEGQNTTSEQMKMFLTRMGNGSKIVVTGDVTQMDLPAGKLSGLVEVAELLKHVRGLSIIHLTRLDICRHPLVQAIVDAYEEREAKEGTARRRRGAAHVAGQAGHVGHGGAHGAEGGSGGGGSGGGSGAKGS